MLRERRLRAKEGEKRREIRRPRAETRRRRGWEWDGDWSGEAGWNALHCPLPILSHLIVISGLSKHEALVGHPVDQAMLEGDSSRPDAGTEMTKGFGFSDSLKRIPPDVFDQSQHFQSDLAIRGNPVAEIFQEVAVEDQEALI
jgi:hypothetical protein